MRACREENDKLCQDNSRLAQELDSSRSEYTTVTSELDVCIISDILFLCHFDWLLIFLAFFLH